VYVWNFCRAYVTDKSACSQVVYFLSVVFKASEAVEMICDAPFLYICINIDPTAYLLASAEGDMGEDA
jgi:hypothetical protein